jgi:hypothetical protein
MKLSPFVAKILNESVKIAFLFVIAANFSFAQKLKVTETKEPEPEGFNWTYIVILGLGIALGGAVFWWLSRRKNSDQNLQRPLKSNIKNKVVKPKTPKKTRPKAKPIKPQSDLGKAEIGVPQKSERDEFLPIFLIKKIEPTRPFTPLTLSNDESLLSAIEQSYEELEEDESVRGLALKILAKFKFRNSVEAISQIALYDISVGLRSRAVSILAEFDHPSVFETILLACADPSREVRAAAANGLFRLSFERTEAWLRLAESSDIGRTRQAARAVIAGDFVQRSIERLIHSERKYVAEAFAIIALLIKAGETDEIFEALNKSEEKNIRKAIRHTITIVNEPNSVQKLSKIG